MLPDAKVVAVEASPFMIICGQRQNRDCVNLEFHHQLAEKTFLQSNTVDTVTITLLLHECSDEGKASILREAYRILKPNGTIILSDTPQNDLLTYRGFYEPWKHQWLNFQPKRALEDAGFVNIMDHGILGGDGVIKSVEEQTGSEAATTGNRLIVFTGTKELASRL